MLLPEPATSLGLHSSSACSRLAVLPPPQRASPHQPRAGMCLFSPQTLPWVRNAHRSPTRVISALGEVVQLWGLLSTMGTPGCPATLIPGADTSPLDPSQWEISPPGMRRVVGPVRGSAGRCAPS